MAARIVDHFGADTLRVIEQEPGRLVEVPGLGPKRTRVIGAAWEEQKAIKEVMVSCGNDHEARTTFHPFDRAAYSAEEPLHMLRSTQG